jgi:hypothetical protein
MELKGGQVAMKKLTAIAVLGSDSSADALSESRHGDGYVERCSLGLIRASASSS